MSGPAPACTASGEPVSAPADISLRDGQTNDPGHFKEVLTVARSGILAAQRAALTRLRTALRGDQCISDVLADYYIVPDARWCAC